MRHFVLILLLPVFLFLISMTPLSAGENDITIGKKILLKSNVLEEEREIWISLPPGYENSKQHYPVFFLMDGDFTFAYGSGIIHYLSSIAMRIPPMIVVGIPHKNRFIDLSYSKDKFIDHPCGAPGFIKFIQTEVIPHIDANYRTQDHRILFGHSLGAMFTLHAMVRTPGIFNAYLAVSPDFIRDVTLLPYLQKNLKKESLLKDFLFVAMEKYRNDEFKQEYQKFMALLKSLPEGSRWADRYFPDENHPSVGPVGLLSGLKALYRDFKPAQ